MSIILGLLRDSVAFVALFVRVATCGCNAGRSSGDVISFALAYEHPANTSIPLHYKYIPQPSLVVHINQELSYIPFTKLQTTRPT